jgi:hypothetical protein
VLEQEPDHTLDRAIQIGQRQIGQRQIGQR